MTIDSDAINRAIVAAAAAGGGTVYFPAGTYASHSIRLRSHVGLHLDQGAVLLAADTGGGRGYDPAEPGPGNAYQDFGHSHWHNSLIWGESVEDVSITGRGRIDGTRAEPRTRRARRRPRTRGPGRRTRRSRSSSRATCCSATSRSCAAATWRSSRTGVDNLTIDNLTIDTNRDGIDIDACRNVRISNTIVNAPNDDAIVLKSSFALGDARAPRRT